MSFEDFQLKAQGVFVKAVDACFADGSQPVFFQKPFQGSQVLIGEITGIVEPPRVDAKAVVIRRLWLMRVDVDKRHICENHVAKITNFADKSRSNAAL